MEETVQIPVTVRGVDREFSAKVQSWRYGMRFLVDLDDVQVIFERDDAGEFRAVLPEGFAGKAPDRDIVEGIAGVLNGL
jgi:hypothetical protein